MTQSITELVYRAQINQAIAYILEHLADPIQLTDIAREAGFSRFHFHRIFAAHVGETIGVYIRRLRLERSVTFLLRQEGTITDIALAAGFESQAAYSKAFRQYYGCPPSRVRRNRTVPEPVPEKTSQFIKNMRMKMKSKIVTLQDQRIIYAQAKGKINNDYTQAADHAFDKICAFLSANNLWGQVGDCLSVSPDETGTVPPEECRYLGGFILKPDTKVSETDDIYIMHLSSGKFAAFRHTGPYETLWQTWNAIYRDWLPSSSVKLRDVEPFEIYLDDKQKNSPYLLRTDIYIAIE